MMAELEATLASLDARKAVRAVVIAGQGAVFCSGMDIALMKPLASGRMKLKENAAIAMTQLLHRLDGMQKATVARIHGEAQGCALGLIAACDIAVAALDTEFCTPKWGIDPVATAVAPYLIRAMGERQARRYLLTGEQFPAAEAYRIGLVHELAPMSELDGRVNEILGHLLTGDDQALPLAKATIVKAAGFWKGESPSAKAALKKTSSRILDLPKDRPYLQGNHDSPKSAGRRKVGSEKRR